MTKHELTVKLECLFQETLTSYKALGEELSTEKAQDMVKEALDELWPEYLKHQLIKSLSLPFVDTPPSGDLEI